jgi:hypothetical protein
MLVPIETPTQDHPRDIYGRDIKPGDNVVYATRRGSSTYLNKLLVTGTTPSYIEGFQPGDVNQRTRRIKNLSTVAKVF